jgi:hypothetical protein
VSVKIVVYGLAKSGTSALFYKIRNSLAPGTIELFEPSSYGTADHFRARLRALRRGHIAPDVLAKVLPWDLIPVRMRDFDRFDRQLLLVRDPRDRLVSDLLYRSYNSAFADGDPPALEFLRLLKAKEAEPGRIPILRLVEAVDTLEEAAGSRADWIGGFTTSAGALQYSATSSSSIPGSRRSKRRSTCPWQARRPCPRPSTGWCAPSATAPGGTGSLGRMWTRSAQF